MSSTILMIKAACGDNTDLFNKIIHDLRSQMSIDVSGEIFVDPDSTLRLAMSLDLWERGDLLPRDVAYELLSYRKRDKTLLNELLGQEGADFVPQLIKKKGK